MNYNLHPIFVHFPIALFLLYSFLRLFPWPKKIMEVDWRIPRSVILLLGIFGSWISNATGEIAERIAQPNPKILNLHEGFATASTNVYFILLILELFFFFNPKWLEIKYLKIFKPLKSILLFIQKLFSKNWIIKILAIIGALLIALTGLLGGVMVYGISADPLASPILKIFGL